MKVNDIVWFVYSRICYIGVPIFLLLELTGTTHILATYPFLYVAGIPGIFLFTLPLQKKLGMYGSSAKKEADDRETLIYNSGSSRIYPDIETLVCKENNTLTVVETTYKHNDMYYIRDGKILSIIDEIYDRHNSLVDNAYEYCNHAIRPDCYFEIAGLLGLKVDKLSFIYIICMWCDNNDEEKPSSVKYLPDVLPNGWENIYNEADEFYRQVFEGENNMEEILKKMEALYIDKETHHWKDDSEIYGGITFGEFKTVFRHLIRTADTDTSEYQCYLDN